MVLVILLLVYLISIMVKLTLYPIPPPLPGLSLCHLEKVASRALYV